MRRRVQVVAVQPAPAPAPRAEAAAAASLIIPMPAKPPRAPRGERPPTKFQAALQSARRRAQSGEWATADGEVLVGLYGMLHELVYGVLPEELEEVTLFKQAARTAAKLLRESFGGEVDSAVEFLKWVWEREQGRVKWAANQPPVQRGRLGWRLNFSAAFVTDYRVAMSPKGRR